MQAAAPNRMANALQITGTTKSRLAVPPEPFPTVAVPFPPPVAAAVVALGELTTVLFPPPAPAGAVALGELRIVLRLELPVRELFAVLLPGPTKKKVAPRRVRFPVFSTKVVRLKFIRSAGTVPLMTVTLSPVWRYIATV